MIFEDAFFELVPTKLLYKTQMNGMNDPSIPDFDPLASSSFYKDEYKLEESQEEFILSYLKSAEFLSLKLEELQKPRMGVKKYFYKYSLALPIIYLCRHCVELSIKYAILRMNGSPKTVHDLEKNWSSFLSYLPNRLSEEEKSTLESMGHFIKSINYLDQTGTKLRYPTKKDGNYSQDTFLWVNSKRIVSTTKLFVKQLKDLDFNNIN